ncbi:MAG: shikimate kinase [Coriobacteriia bacterium]|nr:shikimate kinase [Coriobacteriia bacterium]
MSNSGSPANSAVQSSPSKTAVAQSPTNAPSPASHLIFIGFMGSGKSTIARKLARRLEMPCLDADKIIAGEANMPISQIFKTEGEQGFRKREHEFLKSMKDHERCILSCGGGVVLLAENRSLLKELGTVIYLEVGAAEAVGRISRPETRPLLQGTTPPAELLEQRRALYEESATLTFNTSGLSIGQVTNQLHRLLKKKGIL